MLHWHGNLAIVCFRPCDRHILAGYDPACKKCVLTGKAAFPNQVTNAGKNALAAILTGGQTDLKIRYIALGSSNAALDPTMTTLGNEQFRKPITSYSNPATGQAQTVVTIATNEANNFTIQEIGYFAGPNATSTANSGIMVARVLYFRQKSPTEQLQITRTDTFS